MTVHDAVDVLVPMRVHVLALKVPVPLLVQETVPVGTSVVPGDVSVTITVQVVG